MWGSEFTYKVPVMAFAAIRFRRTTRDIDAKEVRPGPGERLDSHS
jgi:hypothetical protein